MNQLKALPILFILAGTILFAQEKLRVEYEIIPTYEAPPSPVKIITKNSYYNLIINGVESEFKKIEKVSNEQPIDMSGAVFMVEMGSNGLLYRNTELNQLIEERTFIDKYFLISDSLQSINWKITKEKKEFLGFECYKATATLEDETDVLAWYTPKLNFKTGPDRFWGLPGLILEIETELAHNEKEKEKARYSATKVEVLKSHYTISKPTKGKIVSEEEYQSFVEDFYKKQNEMYKGGVDKD